MDLTPQFDPSFAAQSALLAKAQSAASTQSAAGAGKLKEVAQQFEAIFINIMLKEMRKTIPKDGLLSGDLSSTIYREMMDTALSEHIAKAGGFGLGEHIYRELKERAGGETPSQPPRQPS